MCQERISTTVLFTLLNWQPLGRIFGNEVMFEKEPMSKNNQEKERDKEKGRKRNRSG